MQNVERKQGPKSQVKIPSYMLMPVEQMAQYAAPVASVDDLPVEERFEYDLSPEEMREINQIRGIEPISSGSGPVSPFDPTFSASPNRELAPGPKRKGNRPVSVFDLV